jgi:hypothetical protein
MTDAVPFPGNEARSVPQHALAGNVFRDAWEYRITVAGAERLAAGSGASPAFLSILALVAAAPVTFGHLAAEMPHIDGDDLELWLSAMCSMGLLSPLGTAADEPAPVLPAALSVAPVPATTWLPDGEVVQRGPETAPVTGPVVLLVHADPKVRANWRRALGGHGFAMIDGAELEVVERLIRDRRPAWVVLALKGADFDGLHLLKALKRPRAPRVSKVCLVVPRGTVLDDDMQQVAARADARAASVAEIVTTLAANCVAPAADGQASDQAMAQAAGQAATATAVAVGVDGRASDATSGAAPGADAAGAAPHAAIAASRLATPASAPVWMNLLYGEAARYGTAEGACRAALETQYPRLMLRMVEGWKQPAFAAELNQLILDDRGDRQGFAPEVMEELWFLCQTHSVLHDTDCAEAGMGAAVPASHVYPECALMADPSLEVSARKDAWMAAFEGV